jgi:hypothetical protein
MNLFYAYTKKLTTSASNICKLISVNSCWAWWCTSVIPELRRQREGGSQVQGQPQLCTKSLSQNKTKKKKSQFNQQTKILNMPKTWL